MSNKYVLTQRLAIEDARKREQSMPMVISKPQSHTSFGGGDEIIMEIKQAIPKKEQRRLSALRKKCDKIKQDFFRLRESQIQDSQNVVKDRIDNISKNSIMQKEMLEMNPSNYKAYIYDNYFEDIVYMTKFQPYKRDNLMKYVKKGTKYIKTYFVQRDDVEGPDFLKRGDIIFCICYERLGLLKMVLRCDPSYVELISRFHPSIFKMDNDWFSIVIDHTFKSNMEVEALLDKCCEYVEKKFYKFDEYANYITNLRVANDDFVRIVGKSNGNRNVVDFTFISSANYYQNSLNYARISMKDVIEYSPRLGEDVVIEKLKFENFFIYEIKVQDFPVAHVFEKENVMKILFLSDPQVAAVKKAKHPSLQQINIAGKMGHWYSIVVDYTFVHELDVMNVFCEAIKLGRIFKRSHR